MKDQPEQIFRKHGGQLRMSEALACGITRYTLYTLKDRGVVEQITRGIYRLRELPPLGNPDLVTVSLRFPKAVICLVSALSWHDITTQIPHEVSVAVPKDSRTPSLDYPPSRRTNSRVKHTNPASKNTCSMERPSKYTTVKKPWSTVSSSATSLEWMSCLKR